MSKTKNLSKDFSTSTVQQHQHQRLQNKKKLQRTFFYFCWMKIIYILFIIKSIIFTYIQQKKKRRNY